MTSDRYGTTVRRNDAVGDGARTTGARTVGSRPSVTLHIDELVLHGFAPGEHQRIGIAVERELTRLIAEQGAPSLLARDDALAHLDGGAFQVASGSRPAAIGRQVARSLYGALQR